MSYTPQNSVVLIANDDYFRGAPKLGGVEIRYIADATAASWRCRRATRCDPVCRRRSGSTINSEGRSRRCIRRRRGGLRQLQCHDTPFDDPKVRQAIAYAISRESTGPLRRAGWRADLLGRAGAARCPAV